MSEAGWYPDPDIKGARRYFDGSRWGPSLPDVSSEPDVGVQGSEVVPANRPTEEAGERHGPFPFPFPFRLSREWRADHPQLNDVVNGFVGNMLAALVIAGIGV